MAVLCVLIYAYICEKKFSMRNKQITAIRHNTTMYSDQLEKAKRLSKVLFNSSRPNVSGLIQHLIDNADEKSLSNVIPTTIK